MFKVRPATIKKKDIQASLVVQKIINEDYQDNKDKYVKNISNMFNDCIKYGLVVSERIFERKDLDLWNI